MKSLSLRLSICIVLFLTVGVFGIAQAGSEEIAKYLSGLPFTMPEMKEPQFPPNTVSIVEYGAVNDGMTLNTEAFVKAIQKCSQLGGGTVLVPPGVWLTGSIKLESNINLHLEAGAVIQMSKQIEDFPLIAGFDGKSKRYLISPPVYAFRATNIAITGLGIIDGAGEAWRYVKKEKLNSQQWKTLTQSGGVVTPDGKQWWPSKEAMEGEEYLKGLEKSEKPLTAADFAQAREFLRPDMVRLIQSNGILLDGPTFQNSPRFHVYLVQSENIIVRNIKIKTEWYAQNGDGLDLNSCRNALIYNCTIDAGDDGICMKPGRVSERQKPGPACENIVIADCIVYHAHGGFVIGSESLGGARNISVKNCTFVGTDVGLRFKSQRGRGGLIENIYIDNIRMRSIQNEAILFDMYYGEDSPEEMAMKKQTAVAEEPVTPLTPRFQNFFISNIVCLGANRALLINGLPEMPVKNIKLDRLSISSKWGGLCIDADSIDLTNSTVHPVEGPVMTVNQSTNITLDRVMYPSTSGTFLSVMGEQSKNINLLNIEGLDKPEKIIIGEKAVKEAVIIKK